MKIIKVFLVVISLFMFMMVTACKKDPKPQPNQDNEQTNEAYIDADNLN